MEILITIVIAVLAAYILFKNLKKKSKGCNCGSCTSKCPNYVSTIKQYDDKEHNK
jgi:NAD-dependent dihydropyrimidine dehydrogenase PreA subunit